MKVYLTIVLRKLFCVYEVLSCLSFGRDKNPAFNPMAGDPTNSWTSSAPPVEGENDTMSNAQRSTLKWEKGRFSRMQHWGLLKRGHSMHVK